MTFITQHLRRVCVCVCVLANLYSIVLLDLSLQPIHVLAEGQPGKLALLRVVPSVRSFYHGLGFNLAISLIDDRRTLLHAI